MQAVYRLERSNIYFNYGLVFRPVRETTPWCLKIAELAATSSIIPFCYGLCLIICLNMHNTQTNYKHMYKFGCL